MSANENRTGFFAVLRMTEKNAVPRDPSVLIREIRG